MHLLHILIFLLTINLHVCVSVCDGPFSAWNIALIVLGVIFFSVGVIIAIILILLLLLRVKNSDGKFVRVCGCVCVCVAIARCFPF